MITSFDEQLAIDFDVESAIFIQSLAQWTRRNAANNHNFHKGRYWSYNTYDGLTKIFPYWSKKQIERLTVKCVSHGLMIKDNFNQKRYDKTCWYALTDKALMYFPFLSSLISSQSSEATPEIGNGEPEIGKAIPKTLPSSNINITNSDFVKTQEVVDAYHETLPNSPKIKVAGNELTKQIRSMIKNWPKYQKDGKPFSIDSFKDYLRHIQTYYPWFLQKYTTETGKVKRNNLTNITREKNIVRIVNGEFSAN